FLVSLVSPNRFRMPHLQEQDKAEHRDHGRDDVRQPRPVEVGNQVLWDREAYPSHCNGRPDFLHPFESCVRPHQPEGHQHGEEWQDAADLCAQNNLAITGNRGEGNDRRAERAKATGAVLAISDKPEACSGLNPRPIRSAAVTATGVPNPDAPSKNAPKEKAISSSCRRVSWVMPVMLSCKTLKRPVCSVMR